MPIVDRLLRHTLVSLKKREVKTMGKVYLTCGHTDSVKELGWDVYIVEHGGPDGTELVYGSYCTECFVDYLQNNAENVYLNYNEAYEAARD